MAFRIHQSIVRGEIDNRVKGIVRGKVWLAGRAEPIELRLIGNAWPDLAGCLLRFRNRSSPVADLDLDALATEQSGEIGDLTASRKVRVFDVPAEEAFAMIERRESPPERMANCLYLEWFSQKNGRVVIESPDFDLEISAPEWRLTAEENEERARNSAEAMTKFLGRLDVSISSHKRGQKSPEEPWDEIDYERFLKETDARNEKYRELLEKFGDSEEAKQHIDDAMGWNHKVNEDRWELDDRDLELTDDESELDPTREGIDWMRDESGDISHPLQHRCSESAWRFLTAAQECGLERLADSDLNDFVFEFLTTGAKLAGALSPIARNHAPPEAAFTVACLKRALSHLHNSLRGLENLVPKGILPERLIQEARKELFREGILTLMNQLRGQS